MKLSNKEILLMDPVEVYKLRLDDIIDRFPRNFFSVDGVVKVEVCVKIVKYLVEEYLGWNEEELCQKLSTQMFYDYKLNGMLNQIFHNSPYEVICLIYPNQFKPWQFHSVSKSYWTFETGKEAVKWLIEEKLKWEEEQICQKLSQQIFYDNGLGTMLCKVFRNSPYEAINAIYPNQIKPWQLRKVPNGYWTLEMARDAIKWLIEEKLKWGEQEICQKFSRNFLKEYGLFGMIDTLFHNNLYEVLENVYPGKFKKIGRKIVLDAEQTILLNVSKPKAQRKVWKNDWIKREIKCLIEKDFKWDKDKIYQELSIEVFKEHGLDQMLNKVFHNNWYKAIDMVYPGIFQAWKFVNLVRMPKGYWTLQIGKNATKWLVEEKLKWNKETIRQKLSFQVFRENKLSSMLRILFHNHIYEAMEATYPNQLKPWQLNGILKDYWTIETGKGAVKWLVEEELKWDKERLYHELSREVFQEKRLGVMLKKVFGGNFYEAINITYPGQFQAWRFVMLSRIPQNYWTIETGKEAVRWLIEEELRWDKDRIYQSLSKQVFQEKRLGVMLKKVFGGNFYEAINITYPGQFQAWRFTRLSKIPQNYWTLQTGKAAVKWLIEEKLKWGQEQILKDLSHKIFYENGLKRMLHQVFHNHIYEAMEATYPNQLKPWQLNGILKDYWTIETGKDAVKWLVEEELKWDKERLYHELSREVFQEKRLGVMLKKVFGGNFYEAINITYPGQFQAWRFVMLSRIPQNYWTIETGKEAVKWLIEEELKWNQEQILKNLSCRIFGENGLGTMLRKVFHDHTYEAIECTYSGKFIKVKGKLESVV